MSKVTNADILSELWSEGKAYAANAKQLLKNIKAGTKVKPTKKYPDGFKNGEATFILPEEFVGDSLPDPWGGKDMWLLFKINPNDWDNKRKEIEGRK
jgi:hypothetical protein